MRVGYVEMETSMCFHISAEFSLDNQDIKSQFDPGLMKIHMRVWKYVIPYPALLLKIRSSPSQSSPRIFNNVNSTIGCNYYNTPKRQHHQKILLVSTSQSPTVKLYSSDVKHQCQGLLHQDQRQVMPCEDNHIGYVWSTLLVVCFLPLDAKTFCVKVSHAYFSSTLFYVAVLKPYCDYFALSFILIAFSAILVLFSVYLLRYPLTKLDYLTHPCLFSSSL